MKKCQKGCMMLDIKRYEDLTDSLFKIGVEAEMLKISGGIDTVLDKLIIDTDSAYIQLIKFIKGFKKGSSDAENMRKNINIVENITKDNYKEQRFPMPLDKILNAMMEISEFFNELNQESSGDFQEDLKELYKQHHSLFVKIHKYQEQLKQ